MNKEIKHRIENGTWVVCSEHREFPCDAGGDCPYEYRPRSPERNIKGMPLIDWDSRSCPTYGHVCPVFMEDFDFSPEDLEIRAALHCGALLKRIDEMRRITKNAYLILARYERTLAKYPMADYPKYYI